jgi:uncharacterized repeat protein (TIGR02059 family)
MRNTLIFLCLCVSLTISGATYYVSPGGKDSNPGSISQPFFTLNKAWTVVSAGDIVYMRGGTYSYTSTQSLSGKNGTSGSEIDIYAYPGETPVISRGGGFSFSGNFKSLVYFSGNYVHWKGIEITGNTQTNGADINVGFYTYSSNNCTFEMLNVHHNGMGIWLKDDPGVNSNNNLFLNCDVHHNEDPITNGAPYGNGDGLGININGGNTVTIRGCRVYYNSDDGIDPYGSDATFLVENCWLFYNGFASGSVENGTYIVNQDASGFKYGGTQTNHGNEILFTTRNCISYRNSWIGYNQNGAECGLAFYNNISAFNGYDQSKGQGFQLRDPNGFSHILKNNISYNDNSQAISSNSTVEQNTFLITGSNNTSYPVSGSDFVSLDASQLNNPRNTDGSLPIITFLHLASGSRLIDAGVDVGLPFAGKAPDLGPFEVQSGSPAPIPVPVPVPVPVVVPVFTSSVVENVSPSLLVMTYDLSLNSLIVPAVSAFSVTVNSVARTVNAVSVSGTKVQLTLGSAIKYGEIVKVSYVKPTTNPLQTATGGQAISISALLAINNIINPTKDATPVKITMTISTYHIHRTVNILLQYSSSFSIQDPAMSPQIVRISDMSGKLFIEKKVVTGVANIKIPLNLRSGVYNVAILSGGVEMASQKIMVY